MLNTFTHILVIPLSKNSVKSVPLSSAWLNSCTILYFCCIFTNLRCHNVVLSLFFYFKNFVYSQTLFLLVCIFKFLSFTNFSFTVYIQHFLIKCFLGRFYNLYLLNKLNTYNFVLLKIFILSYKKDLHNIKFLQFSIEAGNTLYFFVFGVCSRF